MDTYKTTLRQISGTLLIQRNTDDAATASPLRASLFLESANSDELVPICVLSEEILAQLGV